jgi:hypothetical protein
MFSYTTTLLGRADGPVHRFHPLIEEDCSNCLAQRLRMHGEGQDVIKIDGGLRLDMESRHQREMIKANQQSIDYIADLRGGSGEDAAAREIWKNAVDGNANDQRENMQTRAQIADMRKALQAGDVSKVPKTQYGYPEVFCPETDEFLCKWCARHRLKRENTRFVLPMVSASQLRFTGSARQEC